MHYIAALLSMSIIIVLYKIYNNNEKDEENILEDIPSISIDKEDIEKHAIDISNYYSHTKNTNFRRKLIKSLDLSYKNIIEGYERIDKEVRNKREVAPASEWLLDNIYLIEKEYKHIKYNMPKSYYKKLPVIDKGIMNGYPRIYHIAVELVSHTDGKIDREIIDRFLKAYQDNVVLTSGELWALPIMLRIALIQNISKITEEIVYSSDEKIKADLVADRIIKSIEIKELDEEMNRISKESIDFNRYFTERLLKTLRDNGVDNTEIYKFVDERLEIKETDTEKVINLEHHKQAYQQVSMGNSINSIREVEALNWREIFEKLSFVEEILRKDPANIYINMDFESRDYYRHQIEKLSKIMKKPESFIAKKAIQCAQESEEDDKKYKKHVGYYIVDKGLECVKRKLNFQEKGLNAVKKNIKKHSISWYIGTIITGTVIAMAIFLVLSYRNDNNRALWRYIIAIIVLLVPCSEIIISILNWNISNLITPKFIPKLEFKEGIGEENRTIVVIPTIINSVKRLEELVNNIEVYYLANCDENLYFAILSDFKDSDREEEKNDKKIVDAALQSIRKLNQKYCKDRADIFYFFSRYRQYNEKEGKWIGWERKRGKLMEFNYLIRGDKNTSYNVISGDIKDLIKAKYIITLDSDTQLPRESASKLIGAMSHVLNQPYINKDEKKVARGYGIMQPKISISTLSANKTLFSRMFSGETGIDTYTTAVSDVYQDLFGEGIFTGKGIYHIDTFNYILNGEIPENTILSHDLLEGSYTRTALVTDIELIDGYPAYYNASAKRLHRWVRGDWQLLPWLKKKKSINTLSKWKMFDNLRRSLLSPSIILLTILSFNVLPDGTDKWIIAAILALISPMIFDVTEYVSAPIRGISLSGQINSGKFVVEQIFLIYCFLPYTAYLMIDAIIRTFYRLYISKKNLLEWQTAADVESKSGKKLKDYLHVMWPGSLISILILSVSFTNSINTFIIMLPSCILWFISPIIAWYISKDIKEKEFNISKDNQHMLRRIGRKTWAYFEDFVNEENNWLAPDNYQEEPYKGVSHRTSPTNIAMGLTSNLVAYDFGYIGLEESVDRLDKILNNMEQLESYRGHLYNWYNTLTKEPLRPKYVSTVDSGNLVGYLWIIEESLKEYLNSPFINKNSQEGICDTLQLANEEIYKELNINDYYGENIKNIENNKLDLFYWRDTLINLKNMLSKVGKEKYEKFYWNKKIEDNISKSLYEVEDVFSWIKTIDKEKVENEIYAELNDIALKIPLKDINPYIDEILRNPQYSKMNLIKDLEESKIKITLLIEKIKILMNKCNKIVDNTDFKMLYDNQRGLFSIGYDVEKDSLGKSYYDLLASEARQASFVAIAKGDVDTKHWFKLGRAMTITQGSKGLVSWSGTMFEYLMPLLIMKPYPSTLLSQTYESIVKIQRKYCESKKVPWGISESAYGVFDVSLNYQYKAFGIPGIGLKRGLSNELVISPYSTVMALQVDAKDGINNMISLIKEGLEGKYGFYEAVDYTKERILKGEYKSIVKCFMVHHEGMSLMALDNVLKDNILRERFHNIAKVRATELLLQEKIPNRIVYEREQKFEIANLKEDKQNVIVRKYNTPKTTIPEIQLLSNGSYSMMINNSGSGYSKKDDMSIYRWKDDVTSDSHGMFFYIKDVNLNKYWSAAYEPCKSEGKDYKVIFSQDKVEFQRKDNDIVTYTEVTVSSEDNAEVRRISLTNNSDKEKVIEITSYCEVTLTTLDADIVHPAFSNLFIRTEFVKEPECIIANRRPRAKGQNKPHLVQCVALDCESVGTVQYETSRVNFIGRDRELYNPKAMEEDRPLENTAGVVLDPIISIRKRIKIHPGETSTIAFTTALTDSRENAIKMANKYKELNSIDRAFELAWTQSVVDMKYLGIKYPQANLYETMASKILYLNDTYKEREGYIKNISKGQSELWKYGISGDLPIVLVIVKEEKHRDLVRQMLNAHEYWSLKGLKVDLVILNFQETAYTQPLQNTIRDLIASSYARDKQNISGGVFLNSKSTIEKEDINLLKAISKIVVEGGKGLVSKQVRKSNEDITITDEFPIIHKEYKIKPHEFKKNKLEFFNELGGFDTINDQYVIILKGGKTTPAPWINVISNENFGFIVSQAGCSYTWCKNSRENKITTWSNDWVSDPPSEAIYIRDEESGDTWSITPKPIRDNGEYIIEHGFGYSNFKHESYGIIGEVTMFVPRNDNVKICRIKLKNNCDSDRKLSLTYYAQLVLGVVPQKSSSHIATYLNKDKKYIYGKNSYSSNFANLNAYLKIIGGEEESFTGSRTEFIGRQNTLQKPEALKKIRFSNTVGAGIDPCLAENSKFNIKSGEEKTLIVIFGEDENIEFVEKNIAKYESVNKVEEELDNVKKYWNKLLHTIKVKTPDKTMDIMLNGWLLYQTIACRIWARSAFYQSGGAIGFRDQLQDVMAACYVDSNMTRKHILYSASRQFTEGDVQHWWHPVVDSGIRTRFSDDLLWLPYVTVDYVNRTGDYSILDEKVSYLEDRTLEEGEDERYTVSRKSYKEETIYEHCIKAIERGLKFGPHNIPLMGSGDWNDGMSEVGNKGTGESVWLGWFLYSILDGFKELCKSKNDGERLQRYTKMKEFIKENLNKNAWDGSWYRRAYFDDGTPLGSIENDECQIDSLSQSWAVISKAGDEKYIKGAMSALEKYLVKDDVGMVFLLTPPFENSKLEPGYIKGYVPGVRENGGQYTHASTWVVLAMAMMGEGNKAWKIYHMLNPINHTKSYYECERYKVEPYVVTADVYGREPHIGRGGWSWYTGAAGWMYRVAIEGILGLKFKGKEGFTVEPNIPKDWNGFEIEYTKDKYKYNIKVSKGKENKIIIDGNMQEKNIIPFIDGEHQVEVIINKKNAAS